MTEWRGGRPASGHTAAERITKVAIEREPLECCETPWHIWGRDYDTGNVTEEVWYFETFAEAVAAVPAFFAQFAAPPLPTEGKR